MDWTQGMQRALNYIDANLDGDIDIACAARLAHTGEYHFQRAFSMLTGMALGEYIRMRRLTRAAADIRRGERVLDVALKYGYDSPDSFTRAFARFHGMPPSDARRSSARLNSCSPLRIKLILEGGSMMDYTIEHKGAMRLLGIRRSFEGAPYGTAREKQEERMFVSTRAHQWMLRGISDGGDETDIVAITDVTDEGYTFWYCRKPDDYALAHLYDGSVTGIDFMERFGFEELHVPGGEYAVFRTPRGARPIEDYVALRERIATEWLPGAGYELRPAPELAIYHWYVADKRASRFIEIWLPVSK